MYNIIIIYSNIYSNIGGVNNDLINYRIGLRFGLSNRNMSNLNNNIILKYNYFKCNYSSLSLSLSNRRI